MIPLSQDHHHALALALRCRKQALGQLRPMGSEGVRLRAKEFAAFYAAQLVSHFRAEEEILFPRLRGRLPHGDALIDALVGEHEAIRHAIPQLGAETVAGKLIFDLGDLLERHVRKEERELFPLYERCADDLGAEEIGAEINKILADRSRQSS